MNSPSQSSSSGVETERRTEGSERDMKKRQSQISRRAFLKASSVALSGLPVVACDTDPIPEIVGDTGVVVEKSPDAFSRAFSKLAGDVELRKRLGRAARKRARSLDGTAMEEREARLYEAVIAGDSRGLEFMLSEEHRFIS